jgi:hypothetical protein
LDLLIVHYGGRELLPVDVNICPPEQ